jgi:hypothetical protein
MGQYDEGLVNRAHKGTGILNVLYSAESDISKSIERNYNDKNIIWLKEISPDFIQQKQSIISEVKNDAIDTSPGPQDTPRISPRFNYFWIIILSPYIFLI